MLSFSIQTLQIHFTHNIRKHVKINTSREHIWKNIYLKKIYSIYLNIFIKKKISPSQPATWFLHSSSFWPGYFDEDFLVIPLNHFVLENVVDLKKINEKKKQHRVDHHGKVTRLMIGLCRLNEIVIKEEVYHLPPFLRKQAERNWLKPQRIKKISFLFIRLSYLRLHTGQLKCLQLSSFT